MSLFRKIHLNERLISIIVLFIGAFLTYGVLLPQLGFYRDDWYMIWAAQAQGAQGVMDLFKIDRPFIGLLYAWDYMMLGKAPLYWHIYALLLKLLSIFAVYWLTLLVWPRMNMQATIIALLFAVYPGFYQQPNAALFKNNILSQAAAYLSIAMTIQAVRVKNPFPKIIWTALSLALAVLNLAIYEAMIGLEVARLLLLFYVITEGKDIFPNLKTSLLRTLKNAIPYLLLGAGFVYWRVFLFDSTRHSTNVDALLGEYSVSPLHSVLAIVFEAIKDVFDTTIFAWSVPLYQFALTSQYRDLGISILLAVVLIAVTAWYIWSQRQAGTGRALKEPDAPMLHMLILGALIVIATTLPIVAAGRNVVFNYQWDRYTSQSVLGVVLFMGGLAFHAVRTPVRWLFLFGLLASGLMTQFHSGVYYRDFWAQERQMWWQLSWRVPDLQAGAAVIASPPPAFRLAEEYEVWGPLNMIYNPAAPLKFSGQVIYDEIGFELQRGDVEERRMRSVLVLRDYSKPLIISKPSNNSCLHVINGERPELPFFEDPRIQDIASYSRIDLILPNAAPRTPPADVFGAEPEHAWCYYYQKIDLARQVGNWEKAAALADEAEQLGLTPADRSEWLPVVEAYLNTGETQKASQVSKKIKADKNLKLTLCRQLGQVKTWSPSTNPDLLLQTICGSQD